MTFYSARSDKHNQKGKNDHRKKRWQIGRWIKMRGGKHGIKSKLR